MTITGTGFLSGATVKLGGTAATGVTVVSSTSITATTSAHSAGAVNVVVTNSDGQSGTLSNGYAYVSPAPTVSSITPNLGPTAGGTAVTITGTSFASGTTVSFDGTAATGVNVASSTSITAKTPAHAAGAVNVVVTNSDGQTDTLSNGYTYVPAPTVSSITPNSGPASGGTGLTITGAGFLAGATVSLDGTAATGVSVTSGTSITATAPAHAAGAVSVVVTNTDGQTGTLSNGYTYGSGLGLVLSGPGSATVSPGQSATFNFHIGGDGMSGTATVSCTGAPAKSTCSAPASIPFDSNTATDFSVTVTTTAPSTGSLRLPVSVSGLWLWTIPLLGMVIPPGIRSSRRLTRRYFWLAPLVLLMFSISCGGGGSTGGQTAPSSGSTNATPSGTYTLTVTAAVGSKTAAVPLTFKVN